MERKALPYSKRVDRFEISNITDRFTRASFPCPACGPWAGESLFAARESILLLLPANETSDLRIFYDKAGHIIIFYGPLDIFVFSQRREKVVRVSLRIVFQDHK
jgi:hypothetical protein